MYLDRRIEKCLNYLSQTDYYESVGHKPINVDIPLDSIFFEPWSKEKLEKNQRELAEGKYIYPIDAAYVSVNGSKRLYSIGNGNHRCEAARLAGKTHVTATMKGGYNINLDDYRLDGHWLLRRLGDGQWQQMHPLYEDELEMMKLVLSQKGLLVNRIKLVQQSNYLL